MKATKKGALALSIVFGLVMILFNGSAVMAAQTPGNMGRSAVMMENHSQTLLSSDSSGHLERGIWDRTPTASYGVTVQGQKENLSPALFQSEPEGQLESGIWYHKTASSQGVNFQNQKVPNAFANIGGNLESGMWNDVNG